MKNSLNTYLINNHRRSVLYRDHDRFNSGMWKFNRKYGMVQISSEVMHDDPLADCMLHISIYNLNKGTYKYDKTPE